MENSELLEVLIETNQKRDKPINNEVLKAILSIVMKNPLDDHRAKSQEKIRFLINRSRVWEKRE